ncbi:2Fe-2S iron-sulfur cluster binding domain-containing protein [Methanofollis formosanus]|uniref:2Fe-2S iron-sulfur cluster binding domain-containing protein n=1 Tax=Methanofollis formosanus TaxID=299308 RepID=A0A8G1A3P0_9EURY|nr:2Fe-2S iron-sulfur cluster-binding protein [Methanofollis formosanus]QYZ79512.1 2Fe-2S iron-sulfur cluster binding domain-containing protein [Methanofollis formosanus]
MVEVTIDGQKIEVEKGTTALEAARALGIEIPTLCYHEGLPPDGNCRLCQVEVTDRGRTSLVISCMYPIKGPVEIKTDTERVRDARAFVVRLLLARSPDSPVLQQLAEEYGVEPLDARFVPEGESDLCIRCGRCVRACATLGNDCIEFVWRGWEKEVNTPFKEPSKTCIGCGSCAQVCPTGAIRATTDGLTRTIWGRTFDLVACERCGDHFATPEQLEAARQEFEEADGRVLCQRCRKLEQARAVASGLGAHEES